MPHRAASREIPERVYSILDALHDGVIIADLAGNLIDWNPAALRMHGFAGGDDISRQGGLFAQTFLYSSVDGRSPIPLDEWPIARAIRGESFTNYEVRVERIDAEGSRILSYDGARVRVTGPDGRPGEMIVLTLRDMTARHQAERDRATLAAIVEHSDDAIVGKTLDGIVTSWNRSAARLYGYSAAEMIGHSITRLVPSDRLAEQAEIIRRLRRGMAVEHLTTGRVRRDGVIIDVALTISPLRDAAGRPIGASEIGRDVTREHRAVEAVRASEERFRHLAEAMPQIVYTTTPDGRVTYVNGRWNEASGLEVKRLSDVLALVHPDDQHAIAVDSPTYRATGRPYTIEFRMRHKDGGPYRSFMARSVPVHDASGRIVEWFGTATDVEDLKRAQAVASERQAELAHLERVRTMGQMAAGLAHELNQPLGAIANFAKACELSLGAGRPDPALVAGALAEIRGEALRAGEIVHRLRNFVRKQRPRGESVDVNALVTESLRLFDYEFRTGGLKPTVELAPDLPMARADRVQIGQVIVNLVRNALDAMANVDPAKRSLSISTGPTFDGGIRVRVADRGTGVDPEVLPRVFDAFFTTKPEGMGIGLNLCRTIVEDHGGQISAAADPEGGAVFTFTLRPSIDCDESSSEPTVS